MTVRRRRYALSIGARAGMFLFGMSAVAVVSVVTLLTHSVTAVAIAFAVCAGIGGVAALLAAYGAYRTHLEVEWRADGCCTRCGYDLRESTGRCPECGRRFRRA